MGRNLDVELIEGAFIEALERGRRSAGEQATEEGDALRGVEVAAQDVGQGEVDVQPSYERRAGRRTRPRRGR